MPSDTSHPRPLGTPLYIKEMLQRQHIAVTAYCSVSNFLIACTAFSFVHAQHSSMLRAQQCCIHSMPGAHTRPLGSPLRGKGVGYE
jgi:hypothetical protein